MYDVAKICMATIKKDRYMVTVVGLMVLKPITRKGRRNREKRTDGNTWVRMKVQIFGKEDDCWGHR
jgi:hypothetical protein